MIIIAIAACIVLGGSALALIGTASAHPTVTGGKVLTVPGSKLKAQPAGELIARIAYDEEPPADVTDALAVPVGSQYVGKANHDRGVGPFDRSVAVTVGDSEAEVKAFYLGLLNEEKWVTDSDTEPAPGATEIIATRSGSDGYQWRVAVTLTPVHSVVAPALGGGSESAARTNVTIAIYQVEDAS